METWVLAIGSSFLVSLFSLVGVLFVFIRKKYLQSFSLYLVSLATGALFGDAFIHLLPEAFESLGPNLNTSLLIIAGIVTFLILEKFIHWHHCHNEEADCENHPLAWMNLIGDGVHNLIDGLLIGASFAVNPMIGMATTIAIVFHEIPQEIGDFGVLLHSGFSVKKALVFNFLSALLSVLGVIVALMIGPNIEGFTSSLIPFAAGGFIYIAGSDLLPEIKHHESTKTSLIQLLAMLLGIGMMLGLAVGE